MARSNSYPRAKTDRRRHNKAIVVIRVFTDEIHPAWRLEDARRRLKKLGKSFCQPLSLIVDLWITAMHGKLTLTKRAEARLAGDRGSCTIRVKRAGAEVVPCFQVSGSVRADVFDCGQHRLLYRQARTPAQRADTRAVEQDERTVPNPAPFAARIGKFRMKTEMLANPADGVVDLAILVGSEIEDVDFVFRPIDRGKNGVDAILHVQIRFPLMTVAQHMKMFRMFGKLPVKIKHVPVRVSLAQNRDEAKNVALHSKTFAVRLNQAFRGQLGSSVKRSLDGERTRLRRGEDIRLSVNRSRRRKYNPFAVSLAHRLEHVPGCDRVLIQILAGMFSAETHVGI